MCLIKENVLIENLVKNFSRSPVQINQLQESDAELISLNDENILALTTDSICEEIEQGLYDDPFMIGWMTVTANISDLAAVGATPIGILLNQTFTKMTNPKYINEIQRGINEACITYKTYVLGGDTNYSSRMQMSATAIGVLKNEKPIMRSGCSVGDLIYASGKLGNGNAFAFTKFSGGNSQFKPQAKVDVAKILLKYATSCMDTSDGLFGTIDQLMRVNNLGFSISSSVENYLADEAKSLSSFQKIPNWFMLAGPHGEYELVFTIPCDKEKEFMNETEAVNWFPVKLGEVTTEREIKFLYENQLVTVDTASIRNLFSELDRSLSFYVNELMKIENKWRM
ncbi:MAG: thiamine-phosphate kinase [Ignavibacteria bacterium]|nr:thiamine-phosphate kinase [Ignavibacteria bacterium]